LWLYMIWIACVTTVPKDKSHRTYKRVSIKSPQSLNGMDVFV
jgi:hypothetical protein